MIKITYKYIVPIIIVLLFIGVYAFIYGMNYSTTTITTYLDSKTIELLESEFSLSTGKELMTFKVNAENSDVDVVLTSVPIYIRFPKSVTHNWENIFSDFVIHSVTTGQGVGSSFTVTKSSSDVQIEKTSYNEILVTFDVSQYKEAFSVPSGENRDFKIFADFKPSDKIEDFGYASDINIGYVQAKLGDLKTNVKNWEYDTEGPLLYLNGGTK
jgi:hypothetical protein